MTGHRELRLSAVTSLSNGFRDVGADLPAEVAVQPE